MAAMKGKGLIIVSLAALLVLVMVAQPAAASQFNVFAGPGCSGTTTDLNACGCNSIPVNLKGGYSWEYNGQSGAAYNSEGCTGVAATHFTGSVNGCAPFGWSSFFIQC
ncbi:hypothetical protein M758_5G106700 [Ceratodon purpureus]|uniref:Antimicrobial peptide 1 n=1 Tax=Ceratodon purpureus TaxID=3225 RepID=A0A8T0I1H3_CERPU|nr:hypothetical protein KC19_5G122700 [Ceratodon purpureus]KAG0616340.1 hypothetical protein M758_5G106700 [Ceratodon purpureus]